MLESFVQSFGTVWSKMIRMRLSLKNWITLLAKCIQTTSQDPFFQMNIDHENLSRKSQCN